jgi:hypothetical protein
VSVSLSLGAVRLVAAVLLWHFLSAFIDASAWLFRASRPTDIPVPWGHALQRFEAVL